MEKLARAAVGLVSCVLTAAFSPPANAQTQPSFAGEWVARPDAPLGRGGRGRGNMGTGWGDSISITQDAMRLVVQYVFFGRGDMQPPLKFTYALDGTETKNTVMMGRGMQVETSRTAWQGASLVITTSHAFQDPASGHAVPVEVKRTLTLAAPDSLVVEVDRKGVLGGPPNTTRQTYRRAGGT